MNSNPPRKPRQADVKPAEVTAEEVKELQRDMRSAKIAAWLEENQRNLIYAAVAVVIVIFGSVLWMEQQRSHNESAAAFYAQALATTDATQKRALLSQVVKEFSQTSYAPLSLLLLAALDPSQAVPHLEALLRHSRLTPELEYQGRLDLAELYIRNGDKDKARAMLQAPTGSDYEQLRHYLLAQIAENDAEKANQYRLALDSESHDKKLTATIQRLLAEL